MPLTLQHIRTARRALFAALPAAVLTAFLSAPLTGQVAPVVFDRLAGEWQGEGTLMGRNARFDMRWQRRDSFAFLSFTNTFVDSAGAVTPVLSAGAVYRVATERPEGVWLDSRGVRIEIRWSATDSMLVADWSSPDESGRTTYRVVSGDTVGVVDMVMRDGALRMFATALYRRAPAGDPSIAPAVYTYLDSALTVMQRNVLGGDTVDWRAFRDTVYAWAAGAEEPADSYAAIRRALRALNPHSFLQLSEAQTARERERRAPLADSLNARTEEQPVISPFSERRTPEGQLDTNGDRVIGRIAIPAFGGSHLTAFADSIETLVRTLHAREACGWIVDLRGNGGGNMWPMLAGIGPLLGGEVVGYFKGPRGETTGTWFYRDGVSGIETPAGEIHDIARVSAEPFRIVGTPPVAVLFDRGTGSSGEAVAIAFIGRPATRSFGVPSYGFTTANDGFLLPDTANMVLTVGVNADRNGLAYPTTLVPDVRIAIAPGDSLPASPPRIDPQIDAALDWLVRQPGCR